MIDHGKNGQKLFEGYSKDGRPEGLITEWYENGQKRSEGKYKDGKDDGLHISWYENGQKSFEGKYKDGERVGLHISWYENGEEIIDVTAICDDVNSSGKITDEQAERLSKARHRGGIFLDDLTSITDSQALILSKVRCDEFSLNGLTSITDKQAESLSKVEDLYISAACQPQIDKYRKQ
ncbi:hypothetical protein OAF34_02745 [Pirellulaceae bacterium]|nr:hypothetical protein [Pirellulaceae bacterium]